MSTVVNCRKTPAGRAPIFTAAVAAVIGSDELARRRYMRWGAVDFESNLELPGDHVLRPAQPITTRATTIAAPAADVWPWIVQLGQNRGGFYNYTVW